jgi:hypothetical protein
MGNECSTCACNDQKEIDDSTALNLQKREKQSILKYEEKEYIKKLLYNKYLFKNIVYYHYPKI